MRSSTCCARSTPAAPSRSLLGSGHYASVLRVSDDLAIALCTDGVGSKLVVAEQTGRLDTVGIDCIAMNVNDLICVGAEPIAMLDYLAVEQPDPAALAQIAQGLKTGAEDAGIEIPGGELAVLPELIRGHPSPHGFDLCGAAFGTVAPDALVTGDAVAPGDAVIGLPSSGLHSNGYTLARHALLEQGGLALDDTPPELGGASIADALLEPTVIYVRAILELLASGARDRVHGLAHITGGGLDNLLRLNDDVGFRDRRAAAGAADLRAHRALRRGRRRRDVGRLQHGMRVRRGRRRGRRRGGRRRALGASSGQPRGSAPSPIVPGRSSGAGARNIPCGSSSGRS